jgi:hypothetical protein
MNAEEPYSLLKCKKRYTLVVKQYSVPTTVTPGNDAPGGLLDGLTNKEVRVDAAALSAHNLAKVLREAKLEAYVLHTKVYSLVTIGAFDGDASGGPGDPNLRAMQNLIATRLQPTIAVVGMLPQPQPMLVPR